MRYQKPLFHWLLDIAIINTCLLARASNRSFKLRRRRFRNQLVAGLTSFSDTEALVHTQVKRSTRAYCAYRHKNRTNWTPKHAQLSPRAFGTILTNFGAAPEASSLLGHGYKALRPNMGTANVMLCSIKRGSVGRVGTKF